MDWYPYVSADERKEKAQQAAKKLKRKLGRDLEPVAVKGRTIAATFWGRSWCKNLESYADYDHRIQRGRSYLRSETVLDLQVTEGFVSAYVQGTELYTVEITFKACHPKKWDTLRKACTGKVSSLLDLLSGRLSDDVMNAVIDPDVGLFPARKELTLSCNCLDIAHMCKHVSAVMLGIGARLDQSPELLFKLRQVNVQDLIGAASKDLMPEHTISPLSEDLSSLFGIDIVTDDGG